MIISINDSYNFLEKLEKKRALFSCVISSIETTKYYPISGVHKDVIDYTPASDVELVAVGKSLSIPKPPIDATGCPSPATITRANVDLMNIPFLPIDAGAYIKPKVPYILGDSDITGDISKGMAMNNSKELFNIGRIIGKNIPSEVLIIGECVPGGTTTAMGVLTGLGYDAYDKISSGSINNPKDLKMSIVKNGLKYAKSNNVFHILNAVGDKMMPIVAGITFSKVLRGEYVLLSGGTQMAAVLGVIKEIGKLLNVDILKYNRIAIGTTEFVLNDKYSDIVGLVKEIDGNVPIFAAEFNYEKSDLEGLKQYCNGSVKEGVGAGGISVYSYVNGLNPDMIREYVEKNYYNWYGNK